MNRFPLIAQYKVYPLLGVFGGISLLVRYLIPIAEASPKHYRKTTSPSTADTHKLLPTARIGLVSNSLQLSDRMSIILNTVLQEGIRGTNDLGDCVKRV